MIKYRDDMTAEEAAALLAEIDQLDAAYGEADKADKAALLAEIDRLEMADWLDMLDDGEAALRKAALDHRGQP